MKKNKLRTFNSLGASPVSVSTNTIALKSDREMFPRLLVIQERCGINMRDILKFELSVFPLSLATSEGNLNKTVKSKLFQTLQDKIERRHERLATNPNIFDGMVLLQKTPTLQTFGDLSAYLLQKLIEGQSRVAYFVTDQYFQQSIKSLE